MKERWLLLGTRVRGDSIMSCFNNIGLQFAATHQMVHHRILKACKTVVVSIEAVIAISRLFHFDAHEEVIFNVFFSPSFSLHTLRIQTSTSRWHSLEDGLCRSRALVHFVEEYDGPAKLEA